MLKVENVLFTAAMCLYFAAMIVYFLFTALKKEKLSKLAIGVQALALLLHTAALVCRGIGAGRLPLTNQYEFAGISCFLPIGIIVIRSVRVYNSSLNIIKDGLEFFRINHVRRRDLLHDLLRYGMQLFFADRSFDQLETAGHLCLVAAFIHRAIDNTIGSGFLRVDVGFYRHLYRPVNIIHRIHVAKIRNRLTHITSTVKRTVDVRRFPVRLQIDRAGCNRLVSRRVLCRYGKGLTP